MGSKCLTVTVAMRSMMVYRIVIMSVMMLLLMLVLVLVLIMTLTTAVLRRRRGCRRSPTHPCNKADLKLRTLNFYFLRLH